MADTRGGLISAGTGSRFRQAGITTAKPLIKICGQPLLGWSINQFESAGITNVSVIFNTRNGRSGSRYLREAFPRMHFDITCRDTHSSFESFLSVLTSSPSEHILITTVDAIYMPGKIRALLHFAADLTDADMVLGITDFIDDEKPLYAAVDAHNKITALGAASGRFVTSGIYYLSARLAKYGKHRHFKALRQFLSHLIKQGVNCYGFAIGKSIDVDRPCDLPAAEAFVKSGFSDKSH